MPEAQPSRVDRASRTIVADAAALYRALTDGDALAAWLPPQGMRATLHAFDPRPGGRFSLTLTYQAPTPDTHGKTSADADTVEGRFVELVEDRRIVWDIDFVSEDPDFAGTMRMTWTLEPAGPATTRVAIAAENVPAGIKPEDHAEGLASSLENLAGYVGEAG